MRALVYKFELKVVFHLRRRFSNDTMHVLFILLIIFEILTQGGECRPFVRKSQYNMESLFGRKVFHSQSVSDDPPRVSAYLNGIVYTVDKWNDRDWDMDPQKAIVVANENIIYVGSDEGAMDLLEKEVKKHHAHYMPSEYLQVFDLRGSVILPGFHDIHMHPLEARSRVGGTCHLPPDTDPMSYEMREEFIRCRNKQIGTDWLLGSGHSITNLLKHVKKGGKSPKEILDEYIQNDTIPAVMLEQTSHSIWVNSEALRRANISKYTGRRPGGVIMKDANGEPNGILLENEVQNMMDLAFDLELYPDLEELNYEGLKNALAEVSEYGITSLCDARVYWKRGHHRAWKRACDDRILNARAILGLWAYPHVECESHDKDCDREQIETLKNMYSVSVGTCDLRMSQIKMYSDGLLDSYTAALCKAYSSVMEGLPGLEENIGLNYFTKNRMEKYIRELQHFTNHNNEKCGFDFNIHAIGDRGISESLDAIVASQTGGKNNGERHRITHVEVTDPKDRGRFAQLGVIADFQVAGDFTLPTYAYEQHYRYLIDDRYDNFVSVKSIRDQNAEDLTTFSSDWDVSPLNPFLGIEHATMRNYESVDVKTAIEMYTINPAYAMRQESVTGSLVVGKEADFIVIDQDILARNEKISNTFVLRTVFKGNPIFTSTKEFKRHVEDITEEIVLLL